MKIAICGSLDFTYEIKKIADDLIAQGFEVKIPISSEKILQGEFNLEQIIEEKKNGQFSQRVLLADAIREYYRVIQSVDFVLIANFTKKEIANYIGGNTFLEMGFAHVLHKKIFLLNEIPAVSYFDEIQAMSPIVIHGDLSRIN